MKRLLIIQFLIYVFNCSYGQVKNSVDNGTIRVPVVFHVIYNNKLENLSDSLILNEFRDLNLDFSASNNMSLLDIEFHNLVGNPNIEFYLLDTTFQETGIKGVRRISKQKMVGKNNLLINPQKCLNVFISAHGNATPKIGGDWINLSYKSTGINSHVLTHETGHWLGLYHIFGQIGNSYFWNVALGNHDDQINDTPLQKKATAACYSISSDCPCPPSKIFYKNQKTLYNNFMDYNPCRCMFTLEQSTSMRNYIIKHRQ